MFAFGCFDFEVKPLHQKSGRFGQRNFFLLGHEIEDVATAPALAETIPAIFADADAEGSVVVAVVDRASARDDCHAVMPEWGTNDDHGHGTLMAGTAACIGAVVQFATLPPEFFPIVCYSKHQHARLLQSVLDLPRNAAGGLGSMADAGKRKVDAGILTCDPFAAFLMLRKQLVFARKIEAF